METEEGSKNLLVNVVKDKSLVAFLVSLLVLDVICSIIVATHTSASDITVYTRYTAFGQIHFYKDHWQYTLLLTGFLSTVALAHGAIMIKLYSINKNTFAKCIGWCAVLLMIIATMYSLGVLSLGRAA